MADVSGAGDPSLPLSLEERVDAVCLRYEQAWKAGGRPRPEDFLGGAAGPERPALLRELIALEVEYRRRLGEDPRPEEYRGRFPELPPERLPELLGSPPRPRGKAPALSQGADPSAAPSRSRLQTGADLPCATLGRYRLLGRLGRGGMGDVYLAHDPRLRRQVALKVLPPELAQDPDLVRRFHAEAAAVAGLDHPHVVPVYDHGREGEYHYFAMKYVAGESLEGRLGRRGRLGPEEALDLLDDCLAGLQAAHEAGLVHRDLKPANILLDTRGERARALLADFGLVKSAEPGSLHTATGTVLGTVDYMAPEQAQAQPVDGRADLYSLGVVAYQLLSGRLPFRGSSPTEVLFKHAYEAPPPLVEVAPEVPAEVAAVVSKLLAKSPGNRFQSCAEVRAALEAAR